MKRDPVVTEAAAGDTTSRSRIASATVLQMAARIGGTVASLVTVSLTTRALGPESYGHLQAAIMFVALWTSFTELGINAVIVRRVTGEASASAGDNPEGRLHALVRTNLGLSMVFCLPLTALAMVVGVTVYQESRETAAMVVIIAGSLALTALANSFDPVFMVRVRFGAPALADVGGRFGSMVATIWLVVADSPLVWFALVQLVPPAAQLLIKFLAARRVTSVTPVFSMDASMSLVRESLPQTAILVIGVLYWRIDGVILSLLSTPEQVGLYGLGYTLAFTASMVPDLFLATTLSTSTALFAANRAEFERFVRRTIEILCLIALPLMGVGALLSGGIMRVIGSEAFGAGHAVLALLFVAAGLSFLNAAVSQALFAAHQQVFLMRLNIINLGLNIVLNLAVATHFGAQGAAAVLVFSEAIGVVVASIRLRSLGLHVQPTRFVAWCLIPVGAAMLVAWSISGTSVVLAGVTSALVYVVVNLMVGPARLPFLKEFVRGGGGESERAPDVDGPAEPAVRRTRGGGND